MFDISSVLCWMSLLNGTLVSCLVLTLRRLAFMVALITVLHAIDNFVQAPQQGDEKHDYFGVSNHLRVD